MSSNRTLMVLPGDGVGPEVVNETLRVVDWLAKNKNISFNIKGNSMSAFVGHSGAGKSPPLNPRRWRC